MTLMTVIGAAQTVAGGLGALGNQRPAYQIPPAMQQALALQEIQSKMNMPGYEGMIDRAQIGTAQAAMNATMTGQTAALAPILGAEQKAIQDAEARNAAWTDQQQSQLGDRLVQMAEKQDLQYQMNQYAPYADRKNMFADMAGAGMQNLMHASELANAGSTVGYNSPLTGGAQQMQQPNGDTQSLEALREKYRKAFESTAAPQDATMPMSDPNGMASPPVMSPGSEYVPSQEEIGQWVKMAKLARFFIKPQ
jgi:hypothetical protein